jgi:predicted MPP superfamily phosphohydrolase
MKLLIIADLHFRLHWFRWLIEQAPNFDLVCIAGDLLDMFKFETRQEQAREITRLIRELADLVPVALCSGNHDNAGRLVSYDRASVYEWFIDLGTHRNVISDGSTRKLENLIVTTIPLPLLAARKINLARSRLYDPQANRDAVDRSSSRSGQKRHGRQRRRIGSLGTSRDLSACLLRRGPPPRVSLQNWPKLETKTG